MKKKIINPKINEIVLEMLKNTTSSMSVNQITRKLKEEYQIKVSPQVVKRHLDELAEKGELEKI